MSRNPLHQRINPKIRGMRQSATVAINEHSDALRRAGTKVFRLGLGQSPFPVPDSVVAALRANADQKAYLPVRGLRELRDAVAGYYFRTQRVEGDYNDVLIGPGSKELMFLLQLVLNGEIVIPTPAWVSYAPQARIIGRKMEWLETRAADDWRVTPESLDAAWAVDPGRLRLLVLNYPNNPTGCTYAAAHLEAIAEIARRYRAIVLSDEIYGELQFGGKHVSIARYYPEGTIISGGLSKWCGAGGWRLGTFFFPRELRWLLEAMAAVASETYTAVSAPIQYAAVRAFEGGTDIERYLANARRVLGALALECHRRLTSAGAEVPLPTGAFYLFPDFGPLAEGLRHSGLTRSDQLCNRLLEETGVAILPGLDFGRPATELTARLALVDFDGAKALIAAEAKLPESGAMDLPFLETYCGPVLQAVDRLCDWLDRLPR